MRPSTWERLEADFRKYPILRGEPVPPEEVARASVELGLQFPDDYRDFVIRYGGAMVGPYPVYGLRPCEVIGRTYSVVEVNRRYRADPWPGIDDWLIISDDHAGNPMGFAPDGHVWVSDHDDGCRIHLVATDFEAFLLRNLNR